MIALKTVLTLEEAAEYSGLSITTIQEYCQKGLIGYSRPVGKKAYMLREELEKFLMSKRVTTEREIDQKADYYLQTKHRKK